MVEQTEIPQEPEENGSTKPNKNSNKRREYSEEEKAELRRHLYVNEATGVIEYRDTLAILSADSIKHHIAELFSNMLTTMQNEYRRQRYLSRSSHRQLVQIYHQWSAVLKAKGILVDGIIEQARKLDEFGTWWSEKYRAESKTGTVKFVTPEQMDAMLANNGRMPSKA